MTEVERYKKLKLELEAVAGKLVGLPQRINAIKAEAAQARDESVRAEFLGDPEAGRKRAAVKAPQDEIHKIEVEKEELEHRRSILLSVLSEVQKKAEQELNAIHARAFARAVKSFAEKIRSAHRAELELAGILEAASQAFGEIDSRLVGLSGWTPLLMRDAGSPDVMKAEVARFFAQMQGQGFEVE